MPKVSALIEYIPKKTNQSINSYSLPNGNNISGGASYLSTESSGEIPFIIGASPMGNGDTFWDITKKYPGFMSSQMTGLDGSTNITFGIVGANIDHFTINFDKKANQFGTRIEVLGKSYKNNGNSFTWLGTESLSNLSITIKAWNKPLYPVRFTSIVLGLTIEYSESQIKELIVGSQSVADNVEPVYGVLSQYGSITLSDSDKEILDLARFKILRANLGIKIYFNKPNRIDFSSDSDYQKALTASMVGDLSSEKWNYAYGSNKVRIELKDTLQQWGNQIFDGIQWIENDTALRVFNILNAESNNEVTLDSATENFLSVIKIPFIFLGKSTLLEAWNKLCNLAQIVIYKKTNGTIIALRYQ